MGLVQSCLKISSSECNRIMHIRQLCCCGCSSKTGTAIIFVLSLIALVTNIVVNLWSSVVSGSELQALNVIVVLISAVLIIIILSGIFGVFKQRPKWMIPFMMVQLLGLISGAIAVMLGPALIYIIWHIFAEGKIKDFMTFSKMIIIESSLMIWTGINYYFFVVVFSCYQELKVESQISTSKH